MESLSTLWLLSCVSRALLPAGSRYNLHVAAWEAHGRQSTWSFNHGGPARRCPSVVVQPQYPVMLSRISTRCKRSIMRRVIQRWPRCDSCPGPCHLIQGPSEKCPSIWSVLVMASSKLNCDGECHGARLERWGSKETVLLVRLSVAIVGLLPSPLGGASRLPFFCSFPSRNPSASYARGNRNMRAIIGGERLRNVLLEAQPGDLGSFFSVLDQILMSQAN